MKLNNGLFLLTVGDQMMTVKPLMVREDLQPEHFFKALQKDEVVKEVFLYGLAETVEEIMTTAIVMDILILHGHYP